MRVFLSSTSKDLRDYRERVDRAIRSLELGTTTQTDPWGPPSGVRQLSGGGGVFRGGGYLLTANRPIAAKLLASGVSDV